MFHVYSREALPEAYGKSRPTIFLAGPTPRTRHVPSWRPTALQHLQEWERAQSDFALIIAVPEDRGGFVELSTPELQAQYDWEHQALDLAHVILFWIPRDLTTLPGFTTNVEFGWHLRGRETPGPNPYVVYGRPPGAPHTKYLDDLAVRCGIPIFDTLEKTIERAVKSATVFVTAPDKP